MDYSSPLETQRLILRRFTPEHLDELFRQLSDPEVMRYYPAVLSRDECEKWLEGILRDYQTNDFGMLAVHLKETGDYIGQVGVMHRMRDEQEHHYLSYLLRRKFWGQGYAFEAARAVLERSFRTLGIQTVEALVRPENTPSIRLAERLGMERVGSTEHAGLEH